MMHFQFGSPGASASRRRAPRALLAVTALALLATSACSSSGSGSKVNAAGATGAATTGASTSQPAASDTASAPSSSSSSASGGGSDFVAQAKANVATLEQPLTTSPTFTKVPGNVAGLRGKTVWYIPFGGAIPFLSGAGQTMEEALGHVGVSVHTCDGKFQPPAVASCMQQAIQQKADAVVTGFVDYQLLATAFDGMAAAGIPVLLAGVTADAGPNVSPKLKFYDTTTTIVKQEQNLADTVIADSGGKANILYFGVTDSPQTKQATPIGQKYFASHCPGCKVTTVEFNSTAVTRVPSLVNAALIAHPDANYLIEAFDEDAAAIASAIQAAGKSSTVKFGANGGALDTLQLVKSGSVFSLVSSGPAITGWQFADAIIRQMTGSDPIVTDAPMRVITKDNVGTLNLVPSEYNTFHWYGSDAFKTAYETAWGVTG